MSTRHRLRQGGFTLLELMMAIAVMTMLMVALSNALSPALGFYAKQQTAQRLADLRQALEASYREEASAINADVGVVWNLARGAISPVMPGDTNLRCRSDPNTFQGLGRYLSTSATDAWRDGHSQGLCVFITPLLTGTVGSYSYRYRSIAIVSAGLDGAVDPGTRLTADGVLNLAGDDRGILVDGRRAVQSQVSEAIRKVERVGDAYAAYFNIRYLSNLSRDAAVNYFAKTPPAGGGATESLYDAQGSIATTAGRAVSMVSLGAHSVLGLSVDDVTDPWGGVIMIDNSSDAVRHPDNPNATLRTPAYTARVFTSIPGGGGTITRTIVGSF